MVSWRAAAAVLVCCGAGPAGAYALRRRLARAAEGGGGDAAAGRQGPSGIFSRLSLNQDVVAQVAYILLVFGSFMLYARRCRPYIPSAHVSEAANAAGHALFAAAVASFLAVARADPGVAGRSAAAAAGPALPHDEYVFPEGEECGVCGIERLPRVKHCASCGVCVRRSDHHCLWVGNCVGENNMRHFLAFLAAHVGLTAFGAATLSRLLADVLREDGVLDGVFIDRNSGAVLQTTWTLVAKYIISEYQSFVALVLICGLFATVLTTFACYHLYLIFVRDVTTYESGKIKRVRAELPAAAQPAFDAWLADGSQRRAFARNLRFAERVRELCFPGWDPGWERLRPAPPGAAAAAARRSDFPAEQAPGKKSD